MRHWVTCSPRLPTIYLVPLHFRAIHSMSVISYARYLQDLHATVNKISFFHFIEKNDKCILDISVSRCISKPDFVLLYVCDLSYFDVVLCPSSRRQILATPLTGAVVWNSLSQTRRQLSQCLTDTEAQASFTALTALQF